MGCNCYYETEQDNWANITRSSVNIFHIFFIFVVIYTFGYSCDKVDIDDHCWNSNDRAHLDGLHNGFCTSRQMSFN